MYLQVPSPKEIDATAVLAEGVEDAALDDSSDKSGGEVSADEDAVVPEVAGAGIVKRKSPASAGAAAAAGRKKIKAGVLPKGAAKKGKAGTRRESTLHETSLPSVD